MNFTWHIIRKDWLKLRLPWLLWSGLIVVKLIGYALVVGPGHFADLGWPNRMGEMPDPLLVDKVIAYLLAAWMVHDDPTLEQDSFWITRPISGRQLLAAKLLGAGLLLVAWPVLLNVPWWLSCGFSPGQVAGAAAEVAGEFSLVVIIALAFASVTNGIARFILWTVVELGALQVAAVVVPAALTANTSVGVVTGLGYTRTTLCTLVIFFTALSVVAHQFLTRRFWRSIVLGTTGMAVTVVLANVWPWDLTGWLRPKTDPSAIEEIQISAAGPAHYHLNRRKDGVMVAAVTQPISVTETSAQLSAIRLWARGEWTRAGATLWADHGMGIRIGASFTGKFTEQLFDLPGREPLQGARTLKEFPLQLSPLLAQKFSDGSTAFHGVVELTVFDLERRHELPLQNVQEAIKGRSFSITHVSIKTYDAAQRVLHAKTTPGGKVLFVDVIERFPAPFFFGRPESPTQRHLTYYALIRRSTGEVLTNYVPYSGPTGFIRMNQVAMWGMHLVFIPTTAPEDWLKDSVLVAMHLNSRPSFNRPLNIDPFRLIRDEAAPQKMP